MSIKLQAAIAKAGIASRRKAEELVAQGEVTVNGQPAHIGQRVDPEKDVVKVSGKPIMSTPGEALYYLVHKPVGYISTTSDELGRKTVLDLLPPEARQHRLYPVGRLDQDSEGLLLLTNDGDLAFKVTHPKFEVEKEYHVQLDRKPSHKAIEHLRKGVKLKEGATKPAKVSFLDEAKYTPQGHWLSITISEGKNQQVRRMARRVGYEVQRLIRVRMGQLTLSMLGSARVVKLPANDPRLSA